jgi:8-oxo-dGTP pyrophosphatase MutT (NUDIX family)
MKHSANVLSPAKLKKLKGSGQVAAVCYRLRGASIQFLLVRTGGKRWTFPKGCAEPGLTHAQAAALEAFEEAGIHGCMEETGLTHYVLRSGRKAADGLPVKAFLCKVSRQVAPQESKRNPTWFSPENSKKHLQEGRASKDSVEFARVVDEAVRCIERQITVQPQPAVQVQTDRRDALRRVPFEAAEVTQFQRAAFLSFVRHQVETRAPQTQPVRQTRRLALSAGRARVVEIDKPHTSQNKFEISTKKGH